jgi:CheY-like chemotaxis protein
VSRNASGAPRASGLTPARPRGKFSISRSKKIRNWFPLANRKPLINEFQMPANILIVDDYADNRELLRLMLEGVGYQVSEAEDGHTGLEMAYAGMPDLILVDLSMPKLDGWGVLRELRARERTRRLPCVAVTAHADLERARALTQGFDAYLAKPFQRAELLETVERLLARREKAAASGNEAETS